METLQVRVRKGRPGTDVTEEVEPYVEDAAIEATEVDLSGHPGERRLEIRIRAARVRSGEAKLRVTIRS